MQLQYIPLTTSQCGVGPLPSALGRWWSQTTLSSLVQLLLKCPLYHHCCHAQW